MAVNLTGSWILTRAAIAHPRFLRWGRLVYVTTRFFTTLRGRFHPYGPSKAGLESLAAGHAVQVAGTGITVNVVVPGGTAHTPMLTAESDFDRTKLNAPEVMAPPILWLCSQDADATTGNRYVAAHWDAQQPPSEAE